MENICTNKNDIKSVHTILLVIIVVGVIYKL